MHYIEKMYRNVEAIARRTQALNSHAPPGWADGIVDLLNAHEIGVAIDSIFQSIFDVDDDEILDISLHDSLYLIAIGNQVNSHHRTAKDLGFVQSHAVKKWERDELK